MGYTWRHISKVLHQKLENIKDTLLINRGVNTIKEKDEYITPPHPQDLKFSDLGLDEEAVEKAKDRIKKAKKDKETIVVYTDYDVDGVCGATIVWEGLNDYGLRILPYVPDRVKEGYGLSTKGLENIKKLYNPKLIITVDNGIAARDEISKALDMGIDTIVLDHHIKSKKIDAILIHTQKLCATGIAWYFMNCFSAKEKDQTKNLDIAALATVADCINLIGPNRSIVKHGIESLRKTKRIGLNALIKHAGIKKDNIGVFEIGFILGPRLNAMGRIANALDSLRLMCTKDPERAQNLASLLSRTNRERQAITEDSLKIAFDEASKVSSQEKIIIISGDYNQGIIGLLAGKIVEKYAKPAIVISEGEPFAKASMRSIRGINIMELISGASNLLINSGGHPMAGGFTIKKDNIPRLKGILKEIAQKFIQEQTLQKELLIDCPISLDIIDRELLNLLKTISPFGIGNPEPIFATDKIEVRNSRRIGRDGKHLKLQLMHKKGIMEAIGFGLGDRHDMLKKHINAAYSVEENIWNGRRSLQLNIKDVMIPT